MTPGTFQELPCVAPNGLDERERAAVIAGILVAARRRRRITGEAASGGLIPEAAGAMEPGRQTRTQPPIGKDIPSEAPRGAAS
jgi:hypothetical protein